MTPLPLLLLVFPFGSPLPCAGRIVSANKRGPPLDLPAPLPPACSTPDVDAAPPTGAPDSPWPWWVSAAAGAGLTAVVLGAAVVAVRVWRLFRRAAAGGPAQRGLWEGQRLAAMKLPEK